jgi:hypothetical protein
MSLMSCPNFTVMAVLPQLPHLSCPVLLSCSDHPVLSVLSCLFYPDILWLSYPGCTVLADLPRLSCPSCPAPAFLSPALFPRCPVFFLMFSLPCPICLVLHALSSKSYTDCPVLADWGSPYMADRKKIFAKSEITKTKILTPTFGHLILNYKTSPKIID